MLYSAGRSDPRLSEPRPLDTVRYGSNALIAATRMLPAFKSRNVQDLVRATRFFGYGGRAMGLLARLPTLIEEGRATHRGLREFGNELGVPENSQLNLRSTLGYYSKPLVKDLAWMAGTDAATLGGPRVYKWAKPAVRSLLNVITRGRFKA